MLATLADLEARATLTAEQEERVPAVLADVSAAVVAYCGQAFEQQEHAVRARVKRGIVRLSQRPVIEVISVTDRFGTAVTYEWDGLDRVYVDPIRVGRAPVQVVDITYEAGYDEIPAVIVGVVCSVALRTIGADPLDAAIRQESIDGYSYTLGSTGSAGAYGLLDDERRTLDGFRRPYGSIRVAM